MKKKKTFHHAYCAIAVLCSFSQGISPSTKKIMCDYEYLYVKYKRRFILVLRHKNTIIVHSSTVFCLSDIINKKKFQRGVAERQTI